MGDEDHGFDIALFHQIAHHFDDHLLAGNVQGGGGLVSDQNLGIQNGRHGNNGTLLHTAGQLHRVLIQHLGGQAQLGEPLLSQLPDILLAPLWIVGVNHVLDEADDLLGGIQGVHSRLGDVGDLGAQNGLADGIRIHAGNILSVDDDVAAHVMQGWEVVAHEAQGQGGLAAAGLAGNAQGLAFFDFEGDAVNGIHIFPETGHIFGFEVLDLQNHFSHNVLLSLSEWG